MANYYATCRTNYFRVTDEEKYKELLEGLVAEDTIHLFTKVTEDGVLYHGFGCYGSIDYMTENDEYEFNEFLLKMQSVLPDDEAFMYFESGYEKLRCVTGWCAVVTNKEVRSMSLDNWAKEQAKMLLGDNFETETFC